MTSTPSDPTWTDDDVLSIGPEADTGTRSGPAPRTVDVPSLVAGVVAAVLCAAFAFGDLSDLGVQSRVVWPTILLGIGVAVLLGSRRR